MRTLILNTVLMLLTMAAVAAPQAVFLGMEKDVHLICRGLIKALSRPH